MTHSLVRTLVVSSRPISWINTAYPFAAAMIMTTGRIDLTLVVGTLFFLVPYNVLMYGINDVFDYESDLRNPRKGGAQGGILDPKLHRPVLWSSALLCLPFLIYLFWVGTFASGIVLAISVFFVVAYSAPPMRWKEVPGLDSFTSAVHFVSPAVFGLVLARATWTPQLIVIVVAFLLWGMASHAFGAVQDIVADREGGIASIATALGASVTVRLALASYAAAGVLMLFSLWPGPLAVIAIIPYLWAVWPYRGLEDVDCERATIGWKRFLWINQCAGFVVTMLLIWWVAIR